MHCHCLCSCMCNHGNSHPCQVLQCLVHCADLSNPSKDVPIAATWAKRVLDEFFLQVKEGCAVHPPTSLQCVYVLGTH